MIELKDDEILKPISGYKGYLISNYGRVYSLRTAQELKLQPDYKENKDKKSKYKRRKKRLCVGLKNDITGKRDRKMVHRLVAAAFIGDITDMVVHHTNLVGYDNRVSNLEIMTEDEHNKLHAKYTAADTIAKNNHWYSLKYYSDIFNWNDVQMQIDAATAEKS